jgi:hypothetical protein
MKRGKRTPDDKAMLERAVDLSHLELRRTSVSAVQLRRIFRRPGRELCHTPPPRPGAARFDDVHDPPRFGMTYAAEDVLTALFEARGIVEPPLGGKLVVRSEFIDTARIAYFRADSSLNVLSLTEDNAARMGIVDIIRECDYTGCRQVAMAVYQALPDVDALEYVSRRFTPHRCWAVFDRAIRRVGLRLFSSLPLDGNRTFIKAIKDGILVRAPKDPSSGKP